MLLLASRPCFGPCDPSLWEYLAFGGLLLGAIAAVVAAYATVRRLAARRQLGRWVAPAVAGSLALLLAIAIIPRYPRPTFVPAGVVLGFSGSGRTDPHYLQGSYTVGWTARAMSSQSCQLEAALYRARDDVLVQQLVMVSVQSEVGQSGVGLDLRDLAGTGYYVAADSGCDWRVHLTPE